MSTVCGYEIDKTLGEGTEGTVSLVKMGDTIHALKLVKEKPDTGVYPLLDINILCSFQDPHLLRAEKLLLESKDCNLPSKISHALVLPLASSDLLNFISVQILSLDKKLQILHQILQGLSNLHRYHFLHADIKPLNILVFSGSVVPTTSLASNLTQLELEENKKTISETTRYVLSDFGSSQVLDPRTASLKEYFTLYTWPFRPPEVSYTSFTMYTAASDIWALGMTFLEVLGVLFYIDFDEPAYQKQMELWKSDGGVEFHSKIKSRLTEVPPEIQEVLFSMLDFDPLKRPSAATLLENKLFSKFPRPELLGAQAHFNKNIRESLQKEHMFPRKMLKVFMVHSLVFPPYAVFVSIDLFYISCPLLEKDPKLSADALALTCLVMTAKLWRYTDESLTSFVRDVKERYPVEASFSEILEVEKLILRHLGGLLLRSSYYHYLVSDDHLRDLEKLVVSSRTYLQYDTPDVWYQEVMKQPWYLGTTRSLSPLRTSYLALSLSF